FSHDAAHMFDENDATVLTGLADLAAIVLGHCITEQVRPSDRNPWIRDAQLDVQLREEELCAMLGQELKLPLSSMVTALHLVRHGGLASRSIDMLERQVDRL